MEMIWEKLSFHRAQISDPILQILGSLKIGESSGRDNMKPSGLLAEGLEDQKECACLPFPGISVHRKPS